MSKAPSFKKLLDLSDRRIEIAERALLRAQEAERLAQGDLENAKLALIAKKAEMARARVDVLDRFVGKPTRRVGVSDLLGVLKDQDGAVDAAGLDVDAAQTKLKEAVAHVAKMAEALQKARVVQQKREAAFRPKMAELKLAADKAQEREAEEEFGYARRF